MRGDLRALLQSRVLMRVLIDGPASKPASCSSRLARRSPFPSLGGLPRASVKPPTADPAGCSPHARDRLGWTRLLLPRKACARCPPAQTTGCRRMKIMLGGCCPALTLRSPDPGQQAAQPALRNPRATRADDYEAAHPGRDASFHDAGVRALARAGRCGSGQLSRHALDVVHTGAFASTAAAIVMRAAVADCGSGRPELPQPLLPSGTSGADVRGRAQRQLDRPTASPNGGLTDYGLAESRFSASSTSAPAEALAATFCCWISR